MRLNEDQQLNLRQFFDKLWEWQQHETANSDEGEPDAGPLDYGNEENDGAEVDKKS